MNLLFLSFISLMLLLVGCNFSQPANELTQNQQQMKTTRLHIDGFMKSKSGATWMSWPETVKQALEELAAVSKVEMVLEDDEFLVTYDPSKADDKLLIETVKKSGYTAQVVTDKTAKREAERATVLPQGFPILDKAVAQAKAENKLLVLDLHAEWCIPCRRMEKEVFLNPKVAEQLKRVVFLRIDTDKEPELSEKLGVVGLPDIRFVSSDGKIVNKSTGFISVESFSKKLDELIK